MYPSAKDVIQLGYAVKDLEKACRILIDLQGVGPFFTFGFEDLEVLYRGQPAKETLRGAIGYRGCVQYELIETNFPFYENVRGSSEIVLHHVKRATESFDEDIARFSDSGSPPILEVEGAGICYVDTLEALGHYIELIDYAARTALNRGNLERAERMRRASVGWNGDEPIRTIEFPRGLR